MSFSRDQFDRIKASAEECGFTVITRWRTGLENIRFGDIVLSGPSKDDGAEVVCTWPGSERDWAVERARESTVGSGDRASLQGEWAEPE